MPGASRDFLVRPRSKPVLKSSRSATSVFDFLAIDVMVALLWLKYSVHPSGWTVVVSGVPVG